ncbi:MAG TPA: hypothetical protein VKO16_02390, partial [Polyangia bacterium]|nr:hypothetical protein [Polyangia bacterium]
MPFHQDALGALDQRAAPERALQVVKLSEAAQDDVDRALPVIDVGIVDVGKTPPLDASRIDARSGACNSTITGHAASRTILSISASAC